LEEATTTALKRLTTLEDDMKRINKLWSSKINDVEQKTETLGVKYIELARTVGKLTLISQSTANKQEVERLRTLVEVLR
jgi:hypothetical protein